MSVIYLAALAKIFPHSVHNAPIAMNGRTKVWDNADALLLCHLVGLAE